MRSSVDVERLTDPDAARVVEPLLLEYVPWAVAQVVAQLGVELDDVPAVVEQHQEHFREEVPRLLRGPGRLLVARADTEPVGLGALRPVDTATAEVKRMYVAERVRGQGVGRTLLERLLKEARHEGFALVRLETLPFMTAAHELYRSVGFRDAEPFAASESARSGVDPLALFMELPL